jgi:hypothetical protein
MSLPFTPEGMLFRDFAANLADLSEDEFLAECTDHFLLQFPFTRMPPPKDAPVVGATRQTNRLEAQGAMIDVTMQLDLENVLAAAKGRKQAEGARIHAIPALDDKSVVVVGRRSPSDLVLPEQTVSSKHAEIRHRDDRWTLLDLGSQNGTYVDARRISTGDTVWFKPDSSLWFASYRTIFLTPKKVFEIARKFGGKV